MQNRTKFFEEYNFLKSSKLVKYIIFKYKLNTEYTVCKNFNVDNSYKIQPHMNEDISIIYCGSNIFATFENKYFNDNEELEYDIEDMLDIERYYWRNKKGYYYN